MTDSMSNPPSIHAGLQLYINQHFKDIDLVGHKIESTEFDNCVFTSCNFSEVEFIKCKFTECSFKACNLSNMKVDRCSFFDIIFEECKLIGVNWTQATWPSIKLSCPFKFYQCILNDSSFLGLSLREIVMIECKAHDVDFREADCLDADFTYTDFTNSLFNKTNLYHADFSESTNYNINVLLNEIKKAKFTLPDAINLLNCLDIELKV